MPRKKKTVSETPLPQKPAETLLPDAKQPGLWIDPEKSRRIKGEGGRRGVEGLPSTTRFLDYADSAPTDQSSSKPKSPKDRG